MIDHCCKCKEPKYVGRYCREHHLKRKREMYAQRVSDDPDWRYRRNYWGWIIQGAKNRNECTIDAAYCKDLWDKQEGKCYYTNVQMNQDRKNPWKATLERLDSTIGYVDGNVVLCSYFVNIGKHTFSEETTKKFLKDIYVSMDLESMSV